MKKTIKEFLVIQIAMWTIYISIYLIMSFIAWRFLLVDWGVIRILLVAGVIAYLFCVNTEN